MLILEGGAAGHMMHPYENPDLEFSKMMDIIRAAAGGFQGINVTEKIDGQNVYIGYEPILPQTGGLPGNHRHPKT